MYPTSADPARVGETVERTAAAFRQWPLHEAELVAERVLDYCPLQVGRVVGRVERGWLYGRAADRLSSADGKGHIVHSEVEMGATDPGGLICRNQLEEQPSGVFYAAPSGSQSLEPGLDLKCGSRSTLESTRTMRR